MMSSLLLDVSYTADRGIPLKHKRGVQFGEILNPKQGHVCVNLILEQRYCMGNAGEPGYVHLAGYTDKFWDKNVHVVWDGTQAGEWHPSTPAWKEFIQREVDRQVRRASAAGH